MFSFGSRDEKIGLGAEFEEGEAYDNDNNNDDSTIDPDVSLSYIDEKIQNILGDCQKDFEGGLLPENLGAKFGAYGSFLPTYQRSPVCPNPNTRPKAFNRSAPVSPYSAPIKNQVDNQNSVSQSKASRVRNGSAPRKSKSNGKLKQGVNTSSGKKSKSVSEFADNPDPNSRQHVE